MQVDPIGQLLVARQRRDIEFGAEPFEILTIFGQRRDRIVFEEAEDDAIAFHAVARIVPIDLPRTHAGSRAPRSMTRGDAHRHHHIGQRIVEKFVIELELLAIGARHELGEFASRRGGGRRARGPILRDGRDG